MFVPLTPLEFKRRAVQLFGRKIGVVDGERRFTYAEFGDRCTRLANALLELGLQRGDRVAYLAYNSYPLLEGYFGVLEAQGVLLPLNVRLAPNELAYILRHSGAKILIADGELGGVVDTILADASDRPRLVWLTERPPKRSEPLYDEMVERASCEPPALPEIDENDVAELFYTSGTTGRPKGVMLTYRNLYLHALSTLLCMRADDHDVQLHTIPLFHVNGWGTPQSLTAIGGTHVMMRKFDPGEALRLVEAERVTRFLAVPTMLNMILNHPDREKYDLSSLEFVNTGGAPTPPEMVRRAESALGCHVIGGYGLSETTPVLTFASDKSYLSDDDEQRTRRQASTGLPVIGVDLRIVGPDGQELPWDGESVGEIAVRSNVVMRGYWRDPEATSAVIRDGWFFTGDMAVVDPEGYVLIVDRAKDIIVSGGENISSVEIEKVLFAHPSVLESAVIAVPDEHWGEVPKALVALRPGQHASEQQLIDFCKQSLASFKAPRSIEFVDSLPKGGTGKILKRELRERYWKGQEKRVH